MPITASAGALSYAKIGSDSNLNWDYYAIAMSTYAAYDLEFYSANSYFVSSSATSLGESKIVKITEEPKPKIDWSYQYNVAGYSNTLGGQQLYYDSTSNLVFITEARSITVNTPPYIAGLNAINPTTGLRNNSLAQIFKNNIGNGGSFVSSPIKDSDGNFYLTARDNFGGFGVGTLIKVNKLVNDGSNPTVLGYFETRGANSVEPFSISGMALDSAGYPYVAYNTQTGSFPSTVFSTFIVKYDKTPVAGKLNPLLSVRIPGLGLPTGFLCNSSDELLVSIGDRIFKLDTSLALIWGRLIQAVPAGSTRQGFQIAVDSSNNIYCVANVFGSITGMLLYKLNNSGSLLYSRKISLSSGNLTPTSVKINSGSIYISGYQNTILTGLVIKIPDDGTIPGTGNYPFGGGYNNALLYSVNSSSTAVVTFSPATYAYTTVALPVTISSTNINNTASATTLYLSSIS